MGLADGNCALWDTVVEFCQEKRDVKKISEYPLLEEDIIIVTLDVHFQEIQKKLKRDGYPEKCIFSLDYYLEKYVENLYCLREVAGKTGVEIGGPSKIFTPIYQRCNICDGVNYSSDTVWWKG